jgi:hypothetical protein
VALTVIVDADGVDSGDAHNVAAAAITTPSKPRQATVSPPPTPTADIRAQRR